MINPIPDTPNEEFVILVDEKDQEIGLMEKMEVHRKGRLHRAFSVFLFNEKKQMLLQKRALSKYHSPGLWTNSCCSHPKVNESITMACKRRLREELNVEVSDLTFKKSFIYKKSVPPDLTEHELDHIVFGHYNGVISPNPTEVALSQWVSVDDLKVSLKNNPEKYTEWLPIILDKFADLFNV